MEADDFSFSRCLSKKVANSRINRLFLVKAKELALEWSLFVLFIVFCVIDLGKRRRATSHEFKINESIIISVGNLKHFDII